MSGIGDEFACELQVGLGEVLGEKCFGAAAAISSDVSTPFAAEAQLISAASAARRSEFIAGRACAHAALARLRASAGAASGFGGGGADLARCGWASGLAVGGLRLDLAFARFCVGAVAAAEDYTLLGVDLEMTNRLSAAARGRVVHPREADFAGSNQMRASVLFAAKEAFYKAQFPVWRARRLSRPCAVRRLGWRDCSSGGAVGAVS